MLPPGNFLTESRLADALIRLFPGNEFIRDKIVPGSNSLKRPDFRCDELNLIIEFDGPQHYTNSRVILGDYEKDLLYSKFGYKIVRIPNFIQLEPRTIPILFGFEADWKLEFPHGFISKNVTTPADFCELGVQRFKKDLLKFEIVKNEIEQSLIQKLNEFKNIQAIIPSSLYHIFPALMSLV